MERQSKAANNNGMDGVAVKSGVRAEEARRAIVNSRTCDMVLRILGLGLTLVAAVVFGVNRETQVVAVNVVSTLPPLNIPVTAKWQYMSAFVYFLVANAIACFYAAVSLVLSVVLTKTTQNGITLALLILDLVTVALLYSANGAAAAVGLIGLNGNSHVRWNKVCNVFKAFCRHSTAAVVMSMLGSFVFLLLVLLNTLNLHKKSR